MKRISFLTNRRMPPALAARIEASVRGERSVALERDEHVGRMPFQISFTRVAALALVAALVCFVFCVRHRPG